MMVFRIVGGERWFIWMYSIAECSSLVVRDVAWSMLFHGA